MNCVQDSPANVHIGSSRPVLRLTGITKRFGGVHALQDAHLEVCAGEIHGLVGENGAGKSTLINIACGVLHPDAGEILLGDRQVVISSPRHAAALGVAVVHQEADLFPQLSVAENMLLSRGLVRSRFGLVRWGATHQEAQRLLRVLDESFDVRQAAAALSVARRMMSGIAAAVSEQARVLFLDEPTSSLTRHEMENFFRQVRKLRSEGVGIVYVSHRLDEVLELCDRVTVLRDGETVAHKPAAEWTMDGIVSAMVGRDLEELYLKRRVALGDVRLRVERATDEGGAFYDVSLDVRSGEVLGLYGFVGAGRSELGQALFGLRSLRSGKVTVDGAALRARTPRQALRQGVAYVPEDRLVQAVFRDHSVRTNISVAVLRELSVCGVVRAKRERTLVERVMRDMCVRAESAEQPMGTLSGGNQQKVVFGRWLATAPKVLVLDEPTRGVDVSAKAEIHKLVCDLAAQGTAVLLISSELPEIMAMSDRVVTLSEGRQTGQFDPACDSQEAVAAAAVPRAIEDPVARGSIQPRWFSHMLRLREMSLLLFLVVLTGAMTAMKPREFATLENFLDVLANAALPAIMAQGAMLIICAGGIDISVGSIMGLVGALAGLAAKAGAPPMLCLAMAMLTACLLSLANAATALTARIHPIIVTLAGISIYRGLMRWVTAGREVMQLPSAYRAFAEGNLWGVPKICYYVIAVTIAVHIFLRYTLLGRQVLALGNSPRAARIIGLSRVRLTFLVFAVSGLLVGLTAVLHAGFYGKVQANTGEGWELRAIAAAVIGGTNILGGRGSAIGALLGAFLVALLYNMLILADISSYWQHAFVGALILLAVTTDLLLHPRGRR